MLKVRKHLEGQIFGKLTVIEQAEDYISPQGKHYSQWLCECSCEEHNKIVVSTRSLTSGQTKSCGCYRKEVAKQRNHKINEYKLNLIDEHGAYGIGYCSNSNIEFTFDMDDYDKIKDYCWRSDNKNDYIAIRANVDGKLISIHQIVAGKGYDHIDRNSLNNRKYNLRPATAQENCMNRSIQRNNTSGIIGVYFENYTKKWRAHIEHNGRKIYLGRFKNKDDAIKARLQAEKECFGEFAPQQHLYEQYGIK